MYKLNFNQSLRVVAVMGGVVLTSNNLMALGTARTTLTQPQSAGSAPAASSGTPAPSESLASVQVTAPVTQPIIHNWQLKKLDGKINLVVNPDGSWIFSGSFKDKKPGDDFDITYALKSSTGAIYLFHYEGDASSGVDFSKQGQSLILKDDFATFVHHQWSAVYTFHLSAEGRKARYEALEKKKAEIRRAEEEARKRRDEKVVAEKKAEEKQEAAAELAWEQQYARQHQSGGGGSGSSVSSVVSTIGSVVGTVGSVVGDIASIF